MVWDVRGGSGRGSGAGDMEVRRQQLPWGKGGGGRSGTRLVR